MINRYVIVFGLTFCACAMLANATVSANRESGETLFGKHCRACHPNSSQLKGVKNIIERMRNPLPFMPAFDETKISHEDASEIKDYITNSVSGSDKVKAAGSKRPSAVSGQ